jgi:hypothetical protein
MVPTLLAPPQSKTAFFSSGVNLLLSGIPTVVNPKSAVNVAKGKTAPSSKLMVAGNGTAQW